MVAPEKVHTCPLAAEVNAEQQWLHSYFLEATAALIYVFPEYEFSAQCVLIQKRPDPKW